MKLHFTKTTMTDELSILGSIFTQNGIKTDLDKVAVFEQNEEGTLVQPDIYKDTDGVLHLLIHIDSDRFFMAMGGKFKDTDGQEYQYQNYLLYHDKALNGDISSDELADFIRVYNLPEEERRAEHRATWEAFAGKDVRLSQLKPDKRIEWLLRGVKK